MALVHFIFFANSRVSPGVIARDEVPGHEVAAVVVVEVEREVVDVVEDEAVVPRQLQHLDEPDVEQHRAVETYVVVLYRHNTNKPIIL